MSYYDWASIVCLSVCLSGDATILPGNWPFLHVSIHTFEVKVKIKNHDIWTLAISLKSILLLQNGLIITKLYADIAQVDPYLTYARR